VTAVAGIETSSKQIGSTIGVIDEIALQTNLLTLNAASRRRAPANLGTASPWWQPKGGRSHNARPMLRRKSRLSFQHRVARSRVACCWFAKPTKRWIGALVGDIAASAQEQATGLAEVNTAVNQMDQLTPQDDAMVEEATAAIHSVATGADALARLVGQFTTGAATKMPPSAIPKRSGPVPTKLPPTLRAVSSTQVEKAPTVLRASPLPPSRGRAAPALVEA